MPNPAPCWIGIDLGTSGCRAAAIDASGDLLATASRPLPDSVRSTKGHAEQSAEAWWSAVSRVLRDLCGKLPNHRIEAIGVDATSATLLLCDAKGTPLTLALMYDDSRSRRGAEAIARRSPEGSAARGASSSLSKLLHLSAGLSPGRKVLALHQADWIIGRLLGRFGDSDWNNALKLGFDPATTRWPDWVTDLVPTTVQLPRVHAPGTPLGTLDPAIAKALSLDPSIRICAGTTDSTAAVLATGVCEVGDAVTVLGSTLVMKVLVEQPIADHPSGVYSHRIGDLWIAGGASNSGGSVLRQFFDDDQLERLSREIDPEVPSGLDYYPLPAPGERFPQSAPQMQPRLSPRPDSDAEFLHGLLEGMARIEAAAYDRLQTLGAPRPRRVLSIGGGAGNPVWTRIRARISGLDVTTSPIEHPAYGTALLARRSPQTDQSS